MLITLDSFRDQYDALRRAGSSSGGASAADGGGGVLLLVAPDPDALCAARILTTLLKADGVEVKIAAVAGYTAVRDEVENAGKGGVAPRAIVFVNCGAVANVRTGDGGSGGGGGGGSCAVR